MAVPKKKTSHQKQHSRRARWKASALTIVKCMNCGSPQRPHQICIVCGFYRGRSARRQENVLAQ